MTTQIYRSVKLVLQNSTNENLTVQGVAVLAGRWADKREPVQGLLIPEQSAGEWMSISMDLGTGTSAFVRFGSSRGYLTIRWTLPWAGAFTYAAEDVPGLRIDVDVNEAHPDAVVMLASISEKNARGNEAKASEMGAAKP